MRIRPRPPATAALLASQMPEVELSEAEAAELERHFTETVNVKQGSSLGTVSRTEASAWQTYTNAAYHVTLQYPATWQKDPRYDERYSGSNGFFALGATSGEGRTIDGVADGEAHHKLHPYGSNPQITKVRVSGQEGRLILPAADQPPEMENQAAVVVQPPAPIRVGGDSYHYLLLHADRQHIEDISSNLRFTVSKGTETL